MMKNAKGWLHEGELSREDVWARVLKDHYGVAALDPLPARFRKLLELLEHAEQHDR